MTTYDLIFWLLIILIAVLAYTIESGLSARHRTLVFSSIMSATLAVVYMMVIVDDNSRFGAGRPAPQAEEKKKVYTDGSSGSGELPMDVEVVEGGPAALESVRRYEDAPLFNRPGGFRDCPTCPLMAIVPAGAVIIGSPAEELNRNPNEGPQKLVRFRNPIAVSRYEIQFGEFAAFVEAKGHRVRAACSVNGQVESSASWQRPGMAQPTADHPVVCVSWNDAAAYAQFLSEKTDRLYRLPTESEWEYLARAGSVTSYYAGQTISEEQANFGGRLKGTSSGGKFGENAFKLFDISGNVWEMVQDCWSDDLSRVPGSGVAELGQGDCARSPIRGGGWNSPAADLRSATRRPVGRDQAYNTVGIRLVREFK